MQAQSAIQADVSGVSLAHVENRHAKNTETASILFQERLLSMSKFFERFYQPPSKGWTSVDSASELFIKKTKKRRGRGFVEGINQGAQVNLLDAASGKTMPALILENYRGRVKYVYLPVSYQTEIMTDDMADFSEKCIVRNRVLFGTSLDFEKFRTQCLSDCINVIAILEFNFGKINDSEFFSMMSILSEFFRKHEDTHMISICEATSKTEKKEQGRILRVKVYFESLSMLFFLSKTCERFCRIAAMDTVFNDDIFEYLPSEVKTLRLETPSISAYEAYLNGYRLTYKELLSMNYEIPVTGWSGKICCVVDVTEQNKPVFEISGKWRNRKIGSPQMWIADFFSSTEAADFMFHLKNNVKQIIRDAKYEHNMIYD